MTNQQPPPRWDAGVQKSRSVNWMALLLIVALVVGGYLLFGRHNSATPGGNSGSTHGYLEQYGGSQAVYERIASLSDCGKLQSEFDTASTNHDLSEPGSRQAIQSTGYMAAADDRMRAVGCY